jgi:8-amino-7-oxononanoate synthase
MSSATMPSSPPLASPEAADAGAAVSAIAPHLRRTRRVLETPQAAFVQVGERRLLNFSSNDYLGLANHPRLREAAIAAIESYGVGAGASPLVSGHSRAHEEAEQAFARFVGLPRALLFGSGYAANLGILSALADRHAEIFADKLNHACLNDGALLSRARFTRYPHLDMHALEARLAASRAAVRIVASDAVFSMDGDIAPIDQLVDLCERHGAWLVLDDAHGIGVLGENGRGSLQGLRSPRIVYMATLGKALGGYGAFVAGESATIEWLMQRARTYIYSTALPPMAAAAARAAIELLTADGGLVDRLRSRIAEFRSACAAHGIAVSPSNTAIQRLVVGSSERALDVSARLLDAGYFVPAIRPPTVPEGTSRLRISLSAAHEHEHIESLVAALARALA